MGSDCDEASKLTKQQAESTSSKILFILNLSEYDRFDTYIVDRPAFIAFWVSRITLF